MAEDFKPENPANVGFVHASCAPMPNAELGALPAEVFLKRYVKVGYQGVDPHGVTRTEHMWVLITRVVDEKTIHGLIENDPVLTGVPAYGAGVDVKLNVISQVMPEFKE